MASRRLLDLASRLGRRIVELRTAAGLTQEQLAWRIELKSKGYLSRIESGQRLPSIEIVDRLAHQLDVEPRDLFTFPDAGPIPAAIEAVRLGGTAGAERILAHLDVTPRRTGPAEPAVLRAAEPRRPRPRRR